MPNHEVSFGYQYFWPKAYDAFPQFWEVYPRLGEAIDSLIARGYKNVGSLQKVTINLGILAGTSLVEIVSLVGNGLGHGALKIARSMLEISINAEFLRLFPDQVDNYLDWSLVERYKLMNYIRTDATHLLPEYSKELQDEIDSDFQSVRGRFEIVKPGNEPRLRAGWCSMDLAARASKTGFQEEYRLIYPMGNKLLHGTIGGMTMHADKSVDSARIAVPPSLQYCKLALVGGHLCAVRIVKTISKVMGQDPSPSFDILNEDYAFAWPNQSEHCETAQ
jgi:hypothetical protein